MATAKLDIEMSFQFSIEERFDRMYRRSRRVALGDVGNLTIETRLHWNLTRGHPQFDRIAIRDASGEYIVVASRRGPTSTKIEVPALQLSRTMQEVPELDFHILGALSSLVEPGDGTDIASMEFTFFLLYDALRGAVSAVDHIGPLRDMPERAYRSDVAVRASGSSRDAVGLMASSERIVEQVSGALKSMGMAESVRVRTESPSDPGRISPANTRR